MPIIRSSRLYLYYCRIWCVMPWLLVVGGQVQGSRICVWDEGSCTTISPCSAIVSRFKRVIKLSERTAQTVRAVSVRAQAQFQRNGLTRRMTQLVHCYRRAVTFGGPTPSRHERYMSPFQTPLLENLMCG